MAERRGGLAARQTEPAASPLREAVRAVLADAGPEPETVAPRLLAAVAGRCSLADLLDLLRRETDAARFPALAVAVSRAWESHQRRLHRRRLREANILFLRERRRYHAVFNRMAEPAVVVDRDLHILDANRAFCTFLDRERRTLVGCPVCEILDADLCQRHDLAGALASGRSFSGLEGEILLAGGQRRTVVVAGSFLGELNGEAGGGILVLQDVTERRRYQRRLQEQQEEYRSLIENVPDVIWRSTVDGDIVYISPNIERLTGFTAEAVRAGGRDFWQSRLAPEDVEVVRNAMTRLFVHGEAVECCYRFLGGDGRWRWIQERSTPPYHREGRLLADGVLSDVTALKEAQAALARHQLHLAETVDARTRELREANQRLRAANEELEQFARVVSHDLKEPLVVARAFSQRLGRRYLPLMDDRGQAYLHALDDSLSRMTALVEGLLRLARLEGGDAFQPVVLERLLTDVLADLQDRLAESGGRVHVHCPHTVWGDPLQLWQLFLNLLANALKYHRPGVPPRVEVQSRALADGRCEITVSDNGIGLSASDAQRIFEPFVRLNHHGEGCGIGLATCRKIVLRHGGAITAQPAPETGSVFIVHLPLAPTTDT